MVLFGTSLFVLFCLGLVAFFLFVYIGSCYWMYCDARDRGKSRAVALIGFFLCLFAGWPITLLVWLVLRPEPAVSWHN